MNLCPFLKTSPCNVIQAHLQSLNSLNVSHSQMPEVVVWTYICKANNTPLLQPLHRLVVWVMWPQLPTGSRCSSHSAASRSVHHSVSSLLMSSASHWNFTYKLLWTSTWQWAQADPFVNRLLALCSCFFLPFLKILVSWTSEAPTSASLMQGSSQTPLEFQVLSIGRLVHLNTSSSRVPILSRIGGSSFTLPNVLKPWPHFFQGVW